VRVLDWEIRSTVRAGADYSTSPNLVLEGHGLDARFDIVLKFCFLGMFQFNQYPIPTAFLSKPPYVEVNGRLSETVNMYSNYPREEDTIAP